MGDGLGCGLGYGLGCGLGVVWEVASTFFKVGCGKPL